MAKEIEFLPQLESQPEGGGGDGRGGRDPLVGFTLCDGARRSEAAAISLTVQRLNRLSDASTAEV